MDNGPTRRNSMRLAGYDYARAGMVFVTVCTHDRQRLFGAVANGKVVLTPAGVNAEDRWRQIPVRFSNVKIDAFIVMPDHLHGVLMIAKNPAVERPTTAGDVVRWFKSAMFTDYTTGVRTAGWEPYDGKLWQRNFYDHVVRSHEELIRIRRYIAANPARWQTRAEQDVQM